MREDRNFSGQAKDYHYPYVAGRIDGARGTV